MINQGKRMLVQAEEWLARDLLTEILAQKDPGEVARILGDQVRELCGAKTVLLVETAEEELLYISPARRKGLLNPGDIRLFDLARQLGSHSDRRDALPAGHPFRALLDRWQADSFLFFDLFVRDKLAFQVILLDLPDFRQMGEIEIFFQNHLPVMALALNNSLAQVRLAKTSRNLEDLNRHLESLVRKRTEDMEEANQELQTSRAEALRLMQEAVEQRQRAEATLEELKRETGEREKIEAQLRQAQKMEAVGRLAGGIAHDFNNMLGIIIGSGELARRDFPANDPRERFLAEILKAARRSADLVGQLLAFARQQTVLPRVLDLNQNIPVILQMIRRLIGEDIEIRWLPGGDLLPVMMDGSQMDQILTNLCVNAADAIGGTGVISIETANVTLDDGFCRLHPGSVPGQYVLLAVTDTGHGMDQETLSHIFEPFFTTKGVGEGTGLGLASVWGIVKQNDGFINVYSEPGRGSAFRIYLPPAKSKELQEVSKEETILSSSAGETILLVEDEPALLEIGTELLGHLNYQVISALSPREALKKAGEYPGEIHLLITDLIMPEMNGRDLYEQIDKLRPGIACIFMSGYTANVIAHRGILEAGVNFLAKPFTLSQLADKVRGVLRERAG